MTFRISAPNLSSKFLFSFINSKIFLKQQKILIINFIKKAFRPLVRKILKAPLIVRVDGQSVGSWSYPFILLAWWVSKKLVPRRKVKVNLER